MKLKMWSLAAALLMGLGSASAQVGQQLEGLWKTPELAGAKRGAAGIVTFQDGSSLILREKGGFLLSAVVIVSNPPVAALSVSGGTSAASGSASASSNVAQAGKGVTRAAELVGLLSGFGQGMTEPLVAFLTREDIVPRLAGGLTVTAQPFEIKAQTEGKLLRLDISMARMPDGNFSTEAHALPEAKMTARPVIVRVYSDFQCPYCRQFETKTLPELLTNLPDDVRLEFHQFPLESIHPLARPSAEASECAAKQGKFWEYKDALFADTGWLQGNPNTWFIDTASKLGLKVEDFKNCLAERGGKAAVDAGLAEAARLGLNGTPTVFVNGYRLNSAFDVPGIRHWIEFARVADSRP